MMRRGFGRAGGWLAAALLALPVSAAELRGHGGPVRALAIEGGHALTGSFDTRAILWDLETGAAEAVLRLHAGGVNAVAFLPNERLATGGQDGRIGIWRTASNAAETSGPSSST
jgi:cytochrome c